HPTRLPQTTLRVDRTNPRYFTNGSQPVFLTGSHVWLDLQDLATYPDFDFAGYLDFLTTRNYNFIRLWNLDQPYHRLIDPPDGTVTLSLGQPNGLPFAR